MEAEQFLSIQISEESRASECRKKDIFKSEVIQFWEQISNSWLKTMYKTSHDFLNWLTGVITRADTPLFLLLKKLKLGDPDSTEFYQWNIVDFIRIISEIWSGPVFEKIQNMFQLQNFSKKLKMIIDGATKIHFSCGSWICNLLRLHLFSCTFFYQNK